VTWPLTSGGWCALAEVVVRDAEDEAHVARVAVFPKTVNRRSRAAPGRDGGGGQVRRQGLLVGPISGKRCPSGDREWNR
jgi:hypothetical protein